MSMKFDFRTKLLVIVLTMSLVAVLTSDILIYTLLGVLSVYLIIQGFGRQTIKYLIVCGIFIVLRLLSGGQGITILMPEMFLFMVLRILMMVMAAQPVIGMPPGEVVAVFKKIHAPNGIALPVLQRMRFRLGVKIMAFRMTYWIGGFLVQSLVLTEICCEGKKFIRCPAGKNRK